MEKRNTDARVSLPVLRMPVIVEGRYDKSAVLGIFSGTVITTDGFGIFNSKEKQALIRRISKNGIILLTDSDGGGKQIRSFLTGILPKEKLYHLYIPRIEGKEKRKTHASKEGVLGVEGVGGDVLRRLLAPFTQSDAGERVGGITKTDLYTLGLFGKDNSSERRDRLCEALELPTGMNAKALLSALNIITDIEKLRSLTGELAKKDENV